MKTLVLVIALVLAMGMVGVADAATVDVYSGIWNFISVPLIPFDPDPMEVFSNFDMEFEASLVAINPDTGYMIDYDPWDSSNGFGKILLGRAYYFNNPTSGTISYDGVPNGVPDADDVKTDMWISLPRAGWNTFGHPFNEAIAIDPDGELTGSGIYFTDGKEMLIWSEAAEAGWVSEDATYFPSTGGQQSAGYFFADDDSFRPGVGYFIQTRVPNLAMIVPATQD